MSRVRWCRWVAFVVAVAAVVAVGRSDDPLATRRAALTVDPRKVRLAAEALVDFRAVVMSAK